MRARWAGLVGATGLFVVALACGGLLDPVIDVSYDSPGVQLPEVSGAVRVPLRSIYVAGTSGEVSGDSEAVMSACAQGQNVDGRMALSAMIIEASPGGELRVAGRAIGSLSDDGRLDPAELKGMLHAGAYDVLLEHVEIAKEVAARGCTPAQPGSDAGFEGRALFVLDQRLPYETVQSLMYSAGQAQFDDFLVLVDDPGAPSDRFSLATGHGADELLTQPALLVGPDGYSVTAAGVPDSHRIQLGCVGPCTSLDAYPESELQDRLGQLRATTEHDSVVIAADGGLPWGLVARTIATVGRTASGEPLFSSPILAGSGGSAASAWSLPERPISPLSWDLDSEITVLRLALPSIGPGLIGQPQPQPALVDAIAKLSGAGPLPDEAPEVPEPDLGGGLGTKLPSSSSTAGEPTIKGSIDKAAVRKVMRRSAGQVRYCYQRALTKEPTLSGKVVIRFVVDKEGAVSSAAVHESTMGSDAVESCLVQRVERMRFPAPSGGGIAVIQYPFVFGVD